MQKTTSAGNTGDRVRSDCYVEVEQTSSGGIQLELASKVSAIFGKSIEELVNDTAGHYELKHARIRLKDSGALPFVLSA